MHPDAAAEIKQGDRLLFNEHYPYGIFSADGRVSQKEGYGHPFVLDHLKEPVTVDKVVRVIMENNGHAERILVSFKDDQTRQYFMGVGLHYYPSSSRQDRMNR
ncbi:MAG: hypothetical protein GXP63_02475 [DPANN group archaeon]|nr:hypothetical protein [DPANN group archaeon]